MTRKGIFRAALWLSIAAVVVFACLLAYGVYVDEAADRSAREFCDVIPIGSDISAIKAKAAEQNIYGGVEAGGEYSFFFFHFFAFDKAVCEVSASKTGKVISRAVEIEID